MKCRDGASKSTRSALLDHGLAVDLCGCEQDEAYVSADSACVAWLSVVLCG